MNIKLIFKVISILLAVVAAAQIPSLLWAFYFGETDMAANFGISISTAMLVAIFIYLCCRRLRHNRLSLKDSFILVASLWLVSTVAGSVPFYLSGVTASPADAFFETMSGLSTTGATVFGDVESFPKSLLFWRSTTHFMGGMGIVILTVAIFPLIGIGTVNMTKAETTGPSTQKIMPKIAETARILWYIYIILTFGEMLLLKFAGMPWFDAITHSMGTVSTGGFSIRNEGISSYNSLPIDLIMTLFMFAGGVNFVLYYRLITGNTKVLRNNTEFKVYTSVFIAATLIIAASLYGGNHYSLVDSLRHGSFQAISIMTTSGFSSADYADWPATARIVLLILMFSGGCAGSTSGGIKIIRHTIVFRQFFTEFKQLLRPKGVFILRDNDTTIKQSTTLSVTSFILLYITVTALSALIISTGGYDFVTSVSAAISTIGNVGPGFGMISPMENYGFFSSGIKFFLSFLMLAGRLELYTILILFTGAFRRR